MDLCLLHFKIGWRFMRREDSINIRYLDFQECPDLHFTRKYTTANLTSNSPIPKSPNI